MLTARMKPKQIVHLSCPWTHPEREEIPLDRCLVRWERHQTIAKAGTWGADIYSHELAETLRSDEVMLEAERGPAEVIGFPGPGLL